MIFRILRTSPLALALLVSLAASPLPLQLPTDNDAIYDSPEDFYMYTDRTFEGVTSKPWQAGQYGFVRNMKRVEEGVIGTRFHEGIDIRPVKRDSAGRPLDEVKSIALGNVAYVNSVPGRSNYGNYVVVEHATPDGPLFSLYAHLAKVSVQPGQRVLAGQPLGTMGYTGAGINRERAHVHVELNILLSIRFKQWHDQHFGTKNYHEIHNGMNLAGLDIAGLFMERKKDPSLTITAFLKRTPVYYKVTTPRRGPLEIVERYPFLRKGNHKSPSPSWEISFSPAGFPLAVAPSHRQVTRPLVTYVRTTRSRHEYYTSSKLKGSGRQATLSATGLRYIALVTGDFGSGDKSKSR